MHCYFIGNDAIHAITSRSSYKLRIRLMDWNNVIKFSDYSMFQIANELEGYRLSIDVYSGFFIGKYGTGIVLYIVAYRSRSNILLAFSKAYSDCNRNCKSL